AETDGAAGGLYEPENKTCRRRLARAGLANKSERLSAPDGKADIPDCLHRLEVLGEAGDAQNGVVGHWPTFSGYQQRTSERMWTARGGRTVHFLPARLQRGAKRHP